METTRHLTASTYVVNAGAVLLHCHPRLDRWLPPGGHLDRDELPHECARREVREETGLEVTLHSEQDEISSPTVESLPKPHHVQLADVNVHDGTVGHQHVDMVYYASAKNRVISPDSDEVAASAWHWFDREPLRSDDRIDADVSEIGLKAIETV